MNEEYLLTIACALYAAVCAVLMVHPERAAHFLNW
jgi:hypothetical protein